MMAKRIDTTLLPFIQVNRMNAARREELTQSKKNIRKIAHNWLVENQLSLLVGLLFVTTVTCMVTLP